MHFSACVCAILGSTPACECMCVCMRGWLCVCVYVYIDLQV